MVKKVFFMDILPVDNPTGRETPAAERHAEAPCDYTNGRDGGRRAERLASRSRAAAVAVATGTDVIIVAFSRVKGLRRGDIMEVSDSAFDSLIFSRKFRLSR